MGFAGQILGGSIGFMLGGPIGAILGIVVGSGMDNKHSNPQAHGNAAQVTYFVATFSMLGKLASADGTVSQDELKIVNDFARHQMRLDESAHVFAMKIFHEASKSSTPFEDYAAQFYDTFAARPEFLKSMLDTLLQVSMADRQFHEKEERLLQSAASNFRISQEEYQQIKAKYIPNTQHHYAVLGCAPNASMDEIKKKYRQLVHDFHPDKIIAKGLPEEFSEFASKKFNEIQQAYEAIKSERAVA